MTDHTGIELEAKSDRELLLLVASQSNETLRAYKSIREEVDALKAEIDACPLLPTRAHPDGHNVLARLDRIERKVLYLTAGTLLLAVTAFSSQAPGWLPALLRLAIP